MIRRINLIGGPGCGKSTLAAYTYSYLKTHGHDVELAREFVKSWAYQKIRPASFDQLYITASQLREEDLLLRSGVDIVISDSPLVMQLVYVHGEPLFEELLSIVQKFDNKHPSLNIWLERGNLPYKTEGRYQTLEQAKLLDAALKALLDKIGLKYTSIGATDTNKLISIISGVL